MPEQLVTVATFGTSEEAHLAQNRLEAEGIRAYLADEMTVSTYPLLANVLQGIKLQVADEDADKAAAILGPEKRREPEEREKKPDEETEEKDDEDETTPTALDTLRSVGKPVIWLILAPVLAGFALLAVALLAGLLKLFLP